MAPLTAAELELHPEYPHVIWDLKPTRKGTVPVAANRGGPINISYEIHGHGPRKLLWIMGLGGLKSAWQRQTLDFGHTRGEQYSCLVYDNRGIGESDAPLMRYSTSEMALDAAEVLDAVGWTGARSVHVVGISMGGMIAQELALQKPKLIASLTLLSTAARLVSTTSYLEHLRSRINLFIPRAIDTQLANAKAMLYSPAYLASPDDVAPVVRAFPTAGDRFAAGELRKRRDKAAFTRTGFVCQAVAAGWHFKSREELSVMGAKVGRGRICVVHGTEDRMIGVAHGEVLFEELSAGGEGTKGRGVKKAFFEGVGHVIPAERREEFRRLIEEMVERAEAAEG